MLALDTNVLVRFLTRDDPVQSPRARDLLRDNDTWAGVTVLLETEWVLRSVYRYAAPEFLAAIRALGGLARLEIEEVTAVLRALGWHEQGMDFADALHAALGNHCEAFATFDKACIEAAAQVGLATREP
ncbi:MAG TPA: type II toxin-antitoxin system VapC family toxin [Caulobacteraceae bacterium]|jgi:predicted nucleic acid-binding protein|nr:type II toxin-antitoxin system VapC family toxin [Caulobacteraceae bacterium]